MQISKKFLTVLAFVSPVLGASAFAQVDNTKRNAPIEEKNQLNAQDQGNSKVDLDLTQRIRQEVVKQDSFSSNAKNIKIITLNGVVTLKGPVKTANEKQAIEKIAVTAAAGKKVVNMISVE